MTNQKRKVIEQFADEVRIGYNINSPVNIEDVVTILNGSIKQVLIPLPHNSSGRITKAGDSFLIEVPMNDSKTRQNFTIAHELGHLFLHMGFMLDQDKWDKADTYNDSAYYRFGYSEEEYEANAFAGAFLMPEEDYRQFIEKNAKKNRIDVNKVAKHFKISRQAATIRGQWLGIFNWDKK